MDTEPADSHTERGKEVLIEASALLSERSQGQTPTVANAQRQKAKIVAGSDQTGGVEEGGI